MTGGECKLNVLIFSDENQAEIAVYGTNGTLSGSVVDFAKAHADVEPFADESGSILDSSDRSTGIRSGRDRREKASIDCFDSDHFVSDYVELVTAHRLPPLREVGIDDVGNLIDEEEDTDTDERLDVSSESTNTGGAQAEHQK